MQERWDLLVYVVPAVIELGGAGLRFCYTPGYTTVC